MSRDKIDEIVARHGINAVPCGFSVGDGWLPIVDRTLGRLVELGWNRDLQQVKEKFGGLRVYLGDVDEASWKAFMDVIADAEDQASITCEECGSTKEVTCRARGGWLKTLCRSCRKAWYSRNMSGW